MDFITHVNNIQELINEAQSIKNDKECLLGDYFSIEDSGVKFNATKIPVFYSKDGQTLCLVRGVPRSVIESSKSINVIGECIDGEYLFYEEGQAIYESIYDTNPRLIDEGGVTIEYTPPYKIGVFA